MPVMRRFAFLLLVGLFSCFILAVRSRADGPPPATQPAVSNDETDLAHQFDLETSSLGGRRSFQNGVLTIELPRTDLWVQNDMGEIPTGAGIESRFYFYRCPCGKDRVVGEFALADYEVNDVIDVLRDAQMDIVSIAPMFLDEKPRIMELRFQSEGQAEGLAGVLQSALRTLNRQPADTQLSH